MMADPHGKELTIALADQAFRSRRAERIAAQLAHLLERYGVPQYMDWWERVALLLGGAMAHYLPSLVVPPIVSRLRHETQMPTQLAESPLTCVAVGSGRSLEVLEMMHRAAKQRSKSRNGYRR